jgi:fatty acid-binding protein DegV
VRLLRERRGKIDLAIALEDVSYAVKSGRVNRFVGVLTKRLDVHPVMTVGAKGSPKLLARPRGQMINALESIMRRVKNAHDTSGIERICIVEGVAPDLTRTLLEGLRRFINTEISVYPTTPALLVHTGPRSVGVVWQIR